MLNLRCIVPFVCAFSLLLFLCEIENHIVKIYHCCAGGQESKILLRSNKRWKNMQSRTGELIRLCRVAEGSVQMLKELLHACERWMA